MTVPADPIERAILAVAIAAPHTAAIAWAAWLASLPDRPPAPAPLCPAHLREILPLLGWRRQALGLTGPDWLVGHLNTARVLEQRRLGAVIAVHGQILDGPALGAADPILIGGLALATTLYPDPAIRHTSGMRLSLRPGTRLGPILAELAALGFQPRPLGLAGRLRLRLGDGALALRHPRSLALALHVRRTDRDTETATAIALGGGVQARAVTGAAMFSWLARDIGVKLARPSRLWLIDAAMLMAAGQVPTRPNRNERRLAALVRTITRESPS